MDYFIYLFWAFLAFTVIYDLFFVPIRSVYWFAGFLFALFLYYKKLLPKPVYVFMACIFVFQVFGELYFEFFYNIANYDKLDHFISGIEFCILFYYLFGQKVENKRYLILTAFLFSLSFSYAWEMVEYISDTYFGTTTVGVIMGDPIDYVGSGAQMIVPQYEDTILDMFYSFLGALSFVFGGLTFLKFKKKKTKRT